MAAERGFSLLDCLIACALLSGGYYALAVTQLRGQVLLREAEQQMRVALLAEAVRESVLAGTAAEAAHDWFRRELQAALGPTMPLRTALCPEQDLAMPIGWQSLGCDAAGALTLKVVWQQAGRGSEALRYGVYQLQVAP